MNKNQIPQSESMIPHIDLEQYVIDPEIPELIDVDLAKKYILIPVKKESDNLFVAMADPLNIFAIDDLKITTGLNINPVVAEKQSILDAIEQYYGKETARKAAEDFYKQYEVKQSLKMDDETGIDEISHAPVVRLLNSIFRQAIKVKASDIHIEPFKNYVRIRFRIDGELQEILSLHIATHSAILTRIKIMGRLNIAEKRIPQDGRIEANIDGKTIDLRISTLPTIYGEKAVIRLFDPENFLMTKEQLGFSDTSLETLKKIIQHSNGMILITGPAGSGKTTTMYAILREFNHIEKNIVTIEDPVEYRLDGINQVQINPKAQLTFANALRSILRQDPNIIMVGEIRDAETAQIAIRAAITGHIVISTMHTNDSPSTIIRLMDMGIEPYLLSSAIIGVISQRLVRKICPKCKKSYQANEEEKILLDIRKDCYLYRGIGCAYCNGTGYKGRTAVQEIMAIREELRSDIVRHSGIDILRKTAIQQGMIPLKKACAQLVLSGITTVQEFLKVAYSIE